MLIVPSSSCLRYIISKYGNSHNYDQMHEKSHSGDELGHYAVDENNYLLSGIFS